MNIASNQYGSMVALVDCLSRDPETLRRFGIAPIKALLIDAYSQHQDVQWEIWKWAFRHKCSVDLAIYSSDVWRERGETMGSKALFHLTFEGWSNRVLYGGHDPAAKREFDAILERAGLYMEFGYHWSGHVYKMKGS